MIFLDHNATTPMLEVAKNVMIELKDQPLNPSSIHTFGRSSRSRMDKARKQIANLLGINNLNRDYNLTFTASGTEANNLILDNYINGDIFISSIEHSSVEMPAKMVPNTYIIPILKSGLLDIESLENALAGSKSRKKLVSVMLANNETGIIQPIKEIAKIARKYGAKIHSDIVQSVGKIPVNLVDLDLDFASISGHKFGGGVGCGALISKSDLHIQPSILGGGQERSVRSGTENVLAIAATGAAAEYCYNNLDERIRYLNEIKGHFERGLKDKFPNIIIVNEGEERLPNTTSIIIPGKNASQMVIALDLEGIAISSGSACSSGKVSKSKVLSAMGYDDSSASSAVRISFGIQNTKEEIDKLLGTLKHLV